MQDGDSGWLRTRFSSGAEGQWSAGGGSFSDKHYRLAEIILISVIVLSIAVMAVIWVVVPMVERANRPTYLEVAVAPFEAEVEINGEIYVNGNYTFAPGTYEATVLAEGFDSKTVSFTVVDHQTTNLLVYLMNQAEGLDYYRRSAVDLTTLAKIDDAEVQEFLAEYNAEIAIKNELTTEVEFKYEKEYIWYDWENDNKRMTSVRTLTGTVNLWDGTGQVDCEFAFCLWVDLGEFDEATVKDAVEAKIVELGYNPEDYEVVYE